MYLLFHFSMGLTLHQHGHSHGGGGGHGHSHGGSNPVLNNKVSSRKKTFNILIL